MEQNYETSSTATNSYEEPATTAVITTEKTKFKYDVIESNDIDAVDRKDNEVLEFVPVKQESKYEIVSNDITPAAVSSPNFSKKKLNLLGSAPSKGFRSFSSVNGYHASTSPDNFFKKKYSSPVQEKVFPSKTKMSKADLYNQIMEHYLAGNKGKKMRRRKKKLRKKHNTRHRSM